MDISESMNRMWYFEKARIFHTHFGNKLMNILLNIPTKKVLLKHSCKDKNNEISSSACETEHDPVF